MIQDKQLSKTKSFSWHNSCIFRCHYVSLVRFRSKHGNLIGSNQDYLETNGPCQSTKKNCWYTIPVIFHGYGPSHRLAERSNRVILPYLRATGGTCLMIERVTLEKSLKEIHLQRKLQNFLRKFTFSPKITFAAQFTTHIQSETPSMSNIFSFENREYSSCFPFGSLFVSSLQTSFMFISEQWFFYA